jgi:predicted Zn-dependent protease
MWPLCLAIFGSISIAIEHIEAALRLSPRARIGTSLLIIGAAHFYARRFDEAMPKLLLTIQEDPSHPVPYRYLAACYAYTGRLDDAVRCAVEGAAGDAPAEHRRRGGQPHLTAYRH